MTLAFVHLKKAIDTEPRKMVVTTIRRMGVSDAEARMLEAMYERQKREDLWLDMGCSMSFRLTSV